MLILDGWIMTSLGNSNSPKTCICHTTKFIMRVWSMAFTIRTTMSFFMRLNTEKVMISKSMLGYRPSFHSVTIDITSKKSIMKRKKMLC